MSAGARSLLTRAGVGLAANVVQQGTLRLSSVAVDQPALVFLRHGTKTLKHGAREWTAQGGDAIAVCGGHTLDIVNRTDAAGLFEARWIVWDPELLAHAGLQARASAPAPAAVVLPRAHGALRAAVDQAAEAIGAPDQVPQAIARHRLVELLLWLAECGVRFPVPRPSTAARLRALVGQSLPAPWTVADAAGRLAMSEATLRRRLVAEGTSFVSLLTDARMSSALTLLQSTDKPVDQIAGEVGYESASRFAVRFRRRFGFAPSVVRGHRRST
jgi:AraC-like DNA-binding protein